MIARTLPAILSAILVASCGVFVAGCGSSSGGGGGGGGGGGFPLDLFLQGGSNQSAIDFDTGSTSTGFASDGMDLNLDSAGNLQGGAAIVGVNDPTAQIADVGRVSGVSAITDPGGGYLNSIAVTVGNGYVLRTPEAGIIFFYVEGARTDVSGALIGYRIRWTPSRLLTGVSISPLNASTTVGVNVQFNCMASFSDGTTLDITTRRNMSWLPNISPIAKFTPLLNPPDGIIIPATVGTVTVRGGFGKPAPVGFSLFYVETPFTVN